MSTHGRNVDEVMDRLQALSGPVVVGFDGSTSAHAALRFAADEAAAKRLPLRIVTAAAVMPTGVGDATGVMWDPGLIEAVRLGTEKQVQQAAEAVRQLHPDLPVQCEADVGSAASILLANSHDASTVVVGSHGHGGFLGHLLGGTARQLSTHSPVPTVVVRRPEPTGEGVVVGIDGSPDSVRALAFAFDFADRHGQPLTVLHCWDVPPIGAITGVPNAEPPEVARAMADNEVRYAAEELAGFANRFPTVAVSQQVTRGSAVHALVSASADSRLLVVGSRGRGGFAGLILGSVSHGVLHHATCDVAVVPGRD